MVAALLVFLPFVAGIVTYLTGERSFRGRDFFAVVFTYVELSMSVILVVLAIQGGGSALLNLEIPQVFDLGMSLKTDGFRSAYSLVTSVMWAFTTMFSLEYFRHEREHLSRYYLFVLFTLGATQGVMLSGDLMTTFVFFEILSLTSFTWVMHEETPGAIRAAYTYLFIAIFGGLVLFMGMAMLMYTAGTLNYAQLFEAAKTAAQASDGNKTMIFASGICILIGFGCKAGMFPVHVWLPKAHPVAPSPASALLSGVLTKVGIYGILMTSVEVLVDDAGFGWVVLVLGTITMFLGALLALFSVNLKRTLACSSMSQIGFILVGIGMTILLTSQHSGGHAHAGGFAGLEGHALITMSGTMLHMVNHSMLKLCLFCAAGVVVMNLHELDLNKIRGWGRGKWALMAAFFLGVIGIGGVPLFNGYASKTLLHEAIVAGIAEAGEGAAITAGAAGILSAIEWIFLISGGCTFAYMLKLFICLFVEKNKDPKKQADYDQNYRNYMNPASSVVVVGTSILFVVLGQKPVFNAIASFMTGHSNVLEEFAPLSFECVKGAMISLVIGALLYLVFIRKVLMRNDVYVDLWPKWLDLEDLVYRPFVTKWFPAVFGAIMSVPAENKLLTGLLPKVFNAQNEIAKIPGENKVLTRVSMRVFNAIKLVFSVMSLGMDAVILLLRKTALKEHVLSDETIHQPGTLRKRTSEIRTAYSPIIENFSFALMLSCVGMMVIFGVIMYYIVV